MADTGERARVDFRRNRRATSTGSSNVDGPVATLAMDVREDGGLRPVTS